MVTFTGFQYLLIDIANHFGLDKLLFEERIEWATTHLDTLEAHTHTAENKPLFIAAVMALRRAQKGETIGHLVGWDGVCSGIQIMSAVTGCVAGATATGLVNPNVRADAYTFVTDEMNTILQSQGLQVSVPRAAAKDALMTSFYGSKAKPIEIFGEDTPELDAFYQAAIAVAPGAWELLQDLLASWQPYALEHSWKLPDGFDARVKVMQKNEARIEVDELDHATFTYEFYENAGSKKGLSNVANVIHSIDAYVLRSMHRRCNYNTEVVNSALTYLRHEQWFRSKHHTAPTGNAPSDKLAYYIDQYNRSGMPDAVIFNHFSQYLDTITLSNKHVMSLIELAESMLGHKPFEIVTIHDEFKCHPNNCNHLRQHYIDILASLAESTILSDILSQLHGVQGKYNKLSNDLGAKIRLSNYALS